MTEEPKGTLQEHEKFWAFIILVGSVMTLVLFASWILTSNAANPAADVVYAAKLRIIDAAVAGLLTITGMAAQALFRVSSVDKLTAETALEAAKKLPKQTDEPQDVNVVNTPEKPANVTEAQPSEEALPDYARG